MSTNEEFEMADELLNSCIASVNCGCEVDQHHCDWLYARCRDYLNAYVNRFGEY